MGPGFETVMQATRLVFPLLEVEDSELHAHIRASGVRFVSCRFVKLLGSRCRPPELMLVSRSFGRWSRTLRCRGSSLGLRTSCRASRTSRGSTTRSLSRTRSSASMCQRRYVGREAPLCTIYQVFPLVSLVPRTLRGGGTYWTWATTARAGGANARAQVRVRLWHDAQLAVEVAARDGDRDGACARNSAAPLDAAVGAAAAEQR